MACGNALCFGLEIQVQRRGGRKGERDVERDRDGGGRGKEDREGQREGGREKEKEGGRDRALITTRDDDKEGEILRFLTLPA